MKAIVLFTLLATAGLLITKSINAEGTSDLTDSKVNIIIVCNKQSVCMAAFALGKKKPTVIQVPKFKVVELLQSK